MTKTTRRTLLALAAAAPAVAAFGSASAQVSERQGPATGRVALVTGSSRGIGAATARRLAREGYAVTVNCRVRSDLAAEVVQEIEAEGGRAIWRQADVADPAQVRSLFDANDEAFGGVDVVISNAGIMNTGSFAEMKDADFDRMIATNVKGSFNVLREAARRTRDGGRIISLGSTIVLMTPPQCGPYAATKAVQDRYSSALAKELAGRRISVTPSPRGRSTPISCAARERPSSSRARPRRRPMDVSAKLMTSLPSSLGCGLPAGSGSTASSCSPTAASPELTRRVVCLPSDDRWLVMSLAAQRSGHAAGSPTNALRAIHKLPGASSGRCPALAEHGPGDARRRAASLKLLPHEDWN
jgi:3-oxoacyl-[acyl-carrier protein] reductase